MLSDLVKSGTNKSTEIINEIYDNGEMPEHLSRSIFITLHKKQGANECEQHQTMSVWNKSDRWNKVLIPYIIP